MHKKIWYAALFSLLMLAGCTAQAPAAPPAQGGGTPAGGAPQSGETAPSIPDGVFGIASAAVQNGVLGEAYGKRGERNETGMPTLSPPLHFVNAPDGTACFALALTDPDAVPVAGFEYVHWLAANIASDTLPENASIDFADRMVQGQNDYGADAYGGPAPPNAPHTYVLHVWALDAELPLAEGFTQEELLAALEGHVLAEAELTAQYAN